MRVMVTKNGAPQTQGRKLCNLTLPRVFSEGKVGPSLWIPQGSESLTNPSSLWSRAHVLGILHQVCEGINSVIWASHRKMVITNNSIQTMPQAQAIKNLLPQPTHPRCSWHFHAWQEGFTHTLCSYGFILFISHWFFIAEREFFEKISHTWHYDSMIIFQGTILSPDTLICW